MAERRGSNAKQGTEFSSETVTRADNLRNAYE